MPVTVAITDFRWLRGVCKKIGILRISAHTGGNRGKIRKNN